MAVGAGGTLVRRQDTRLWHGDCIGGIGGRLVARRSGRMRSHRTDTDIRSLGFLLIFVFVLSLLVILHSAGVIPQL
jgi:hypothetical protein